MKTKLPESRNRNLPPPPAAAPLEPGRRLSHLPQPPPREEPTVLRSLVVLIIIVGLLGTGIFFYIRNAMTDAKLESSIEASLKAAGEELWKFGSSSVFFADTEATRRDLDDLPRVVNAVRTSVKNAIPDITVVEVDPGKDLGAHQIIFRIRDNTVLVVRTRYDKSTGSFRFIEERNGIGASRKEQQTLPAVSDRLGPGISAPVPLPGRSIPFPEPGVIPSPADPLQPGITPPPAVPLQPGITAPLPAPSTPPAAVPPTPPP